MSNIPSLESEASLDGPIGVPQGCPTYVVQPGDTLSRIAQTHGTTVEELAQANGIADPNRIAANEGLIICN